MIHHGEDIPSHSSTERNTRPFLTARPPKRTAASQVHHVACPYDRPVEVTGQLRTAQVASTGVARSLLFTLGRLLCWIDAGWCLTTVTGKDYLGHKPQRPPALGQFSMTE